MWWNYASNTQLCWFITRELYSGVRIQSGGSTCGRLLSKIYSSEANTLDASASARDDIHAQFITYKVRSDQI